MINDLLNAIESTSYSEIVFYGLCFILIELFVLYSMFRMPLFPLYEMFPVGRI